MSESLKIYEDNLLKIEQADFCSVPGYLLIRIKHDIYSLADLKPKQSQHLGLILSKTAQALQNTLNAERIYCLSFCELDPRLHFHLLPRTKLLLQLYYQDTDSDNEPINGALLFEWARASFVCSEQIPEGFPSLLDLCAQLQILMR
jgi:diadenosine tetraphosphate (Ap4A) HIT family hydrolase